MVSTVPQKRPAPLACTGCRARHLKCDGTTPCCRRCTADDIQCTYEASRRGYGRRRPNGKQSDVTRQTITAETVNLLTPESAVSTGGSRPHARSSGSITHGHSSSAGSNELPTESTTGFLTRPALLQLESIDKELLIKMFYVHFHPAHPLLVPRRFFSRQRYPDYLQWTIFFIAQQYVVQQSASYMEIEATVKAMLVSENDDITVHRVQALVLYAIVLHSLHRPQEALECIRRACEIANALSIYHAEFSSWHAAPLSVEEESIRRTWWELYVVETYLAALHRQPSLLSKLEGPYPSLPSSERRYNAGSCDPEPSSLTRFENRAFAQDSFPRQFSTFCYRIDSIRITSRVLALFEDGDGSVDAAQAVDIAIASWKYHLPSTADGSEHDPGDMDQLMFQAHFFVHTASILLHFPRSDLPPKVPSAADIACVKGHTHGIPSLTQHSKKAVAASKGICDLAASICSTDTCSPLFICALILACIVQLAASTLHRSRGADTGQHRDRIILLLGLLAELGRRWAVARDALQPLKTIADTIFGEPRPETALPLDQLPVQGENENAKDVAGIPWFDLFSMDELMADFVTPEGERAFQEP